MRLIQTSFPRPLRSLATVSKMRPPKIAMRVRLFFLLFTVVTVAIAFAAVAAAAEANKSKQLQPFVTIPVSPACNPTCTQSLQNAVASCSSATYCTIELEAATYILDGPAYGTRVTITGGKNIWITGSSSSTRTITASPTTSSSSSSTPTIPSQTLLLLTDIATVFVVNGGSNITFTGFTIDMMRVPFTYGQVTSVEETSSTVTFDSSTTGNGTTSYPIDTTRYPWLLRAQGVLSFDPINNRVAANATDIYALSDPIPITYSSPSTPSPVANLTIATKLRLHDYVIIRHQTYSYNAFSAYGVTQGTNILNVTLYSVAGMGLYTDSCSGGVTVDGLQIVRVSGRPMSITADGMHFSNTRGGKLQISNCWIEGQGDDGLNMPTLFQGIIWVSPDRLSIRVEGRPGQGVSSPVVNSGDYMHVYNRSNIDLLGTVQVLSIGSNNTVVLAAPGLPLGAGLYSAINNANDYATSVLLQGNTFKSNRARGALLKASNLTAMNNSFIDCSGPAVKTETDGCFWYEGAPVKNWNLIGNYIEGCNYGVAQMYGDVIIDNSVPVFVNGVPTATCEPYTGASPAVQSDVTISGNTFNQSSGLSSVFVYSTAGFTLQDNVVTQQSGTYRPVYDFQGAGVAGVSMSGNVCDGGACLSTGL